MTDRQAAADSVVRLLTLAERRGVISGAEHRYARDAIEALSVRLAQAEQERDRANDEAGMYALALNATEVRLREYEEALRLAEGLTLLHKVEPDTTDSGADLTGFDAIDCAACIFNVARGKPDRRDPAKVAASGGREAPDTKEPA